MDNGNILYELFLIGVASYIVWAFLEKQRYRDLILYPDDFYANVKHISVNEFGAVYAVMRNKNDREFLFSGTRADARLFAAVLNNRIAKFRKDNIISNRTSVALDQILELEVSQCCLTQ